MILVVIRTKVESPISKSIVTTHGPHHPATVVLIIRLIMSYLESSGQIYKGALIRVTAALL